MKQHIYEIYDRKHTISIKYIKYHICERYDIEYHIYKSISPVTSTLYIKLPLAPPKTFLCMIFKELHFLEVATVQNQVQFG